MIESMEIETPVLVRVWHEGARIEQCYAMSVECDGDSIELIRNDDTEVTYGPGEWDDMTVQYHP